MRRKKAEISRQKERERGREGNRGSVEKEDRGKRNVRSREMSVQSL